MRFAEKAGLRILPNPLEKDAVCPMCKSSVIGKCGQIKVWHWAHKTSEDCDSWGGRETDWHLNWKAEFPQETQEVTIEKCDCEMCAPVTCNHNHSYPCAIKIHRADVKIKDIVLEFQSSSISSEQIREREEFYGKMKWILNGETFAKNLNIFPKKGFYSFKWKYLPKSWLAANSPIYIDLSSMKSELINEIKRYSDGEKHYSSYTEESWEWEDDDGNIRDSQFPNYIKQTYEDTKEYLQKLNKKLDVLMSKDIFLVKKLYDKGTGWGVFISKEDFIRECKDGYYRN